MNAVLRIFTAALVCVGTGSCSPELSAMINYSTVRAQRHAQWFVEENTLAMQATNPQGLNLAVAVEPRLDQGRVVLVAGVTSSGSAGLKTYCFDIAPLAPPADWPRRVYWRDTSGDLRQVAVIGHGDAVRSALEVCRGRI